MDYILEEMNRIGADGVDFVPIWFGEGIPPIICSYTKEEWKDVKAYPKTNRLYWKIVDGKRQYINKIQD